MTPHSRLKQVRSYLELTQRELATEIGVKPSYYSDLENGHRTITRKFLDKIKNKFNISVEWVITGNGEMVTLKSEQKEYPKNVPLNVPQAENIEIEISKWEYTHRAIRELEKENPNLYKLVNNISEITDFEDIIKDFRKEYLADYYNNFTLSQKEIRSKPTYKEFKEHWIKSVKQLEPISFLLESLANNINEFKAFFSKYDTKDILGYKASEQLFSTKK